MFRRALQLFLLLALILGGSAEALRAPLRVACACGCPDTDGPTCPCGMPKGPSTPQGPQAVLCAPAGAVAPQAAEAAQGLRREALPCPLAAAGKAPEALGFQAGLGHGSSRFAPPRRALDRLAEMATFRI